MASVFSFCFPLEQPVPSFIHGTRADTQTSRQADTQTRRQADMQSHRRTETQRKTDTHTLASLPALLATIVGAKGARPLQTQRNMAVTGMRFVIYSPIDDGRTHASHSFKVAC